MSNVSAAQNRELRSTSDVAGLCIRLFGPITITAGNRPISVVSRKARALVGYLAVREGAEIARTTLTGLLWGDRGEGQARASLRQTLSELRSALGEAAEGFLVTSKESVRLTKGSAWIDASALQSAVTAGDHDALSRSAELIGGELMEGLAIGEAGFEQWLAAERERFHLLACRIHMRLMERAEHDGKLEEALAHGSMLLSLDPLQEQVHRALMRIYASQGRQDAALAQYERCRRELSDQLGVLPERETEDLARSIRASRRETQPRPQVSPPAHSITGESEWPRKADRPSIAVLPFANLSADPDQQYLSDGITEDIITELSRYTDLLVIASNSSFRYRDTSVDMKRVGVDLGVEYLLEGSLRKAGDRIRITAQLIAVSTGSHLWAERYDRRLQDVFAVQEELARTITATLVGRVAASGTETARGKPTELWAAYDCFLQAMECQNRYETERAIALLTRAIELDPRYTQAYAMLAFVHVWKFYVDYSAATLNAALEHAQKALSIDNNDGLSHAVMGLVQTHLLNWEIAGMHLKAALSLNPNNVFFAGKYANWLLRMGCPQESLQILDAALERDPLQPPWYWEVRTMALLREKRYDEAISSINHKNPMQSWDHATLAIAQAHRGNDVQARAEAAIAVRMQPNFSIGGYAFTAPYKDPADLQDMIDGMRKAGLPE